METTIVYWGNIGLMEKKMETTIKSQSANIEEAVAFGGKGRMTYVWPRGRSIILQKSTVPISPLDVLPG